MPDEWEEQNGLSPAVADQYEDPDGDGLINLHEYRFGYDPQIADGTNTLISAFSHGVDTLLTNGVSDLNMFVDYPSTNSVNALERNPSFYALPVDLTSISVWNSQSLTQRCATVMSPYHIAGAAHFQVSAGQSVFFLGDDDVVYSNKVIGAQSYQYHYWNSPAETLDISVGVLDSPLPSCVHPMKILPKESMSRLGSGVGLPALSVNQNREVFVRDVSSPIMPHNTNEYVTIQYTRPTNTLRQSCYGVIRGGDSSSSNFFVVDNVPVLLGFHLRANAAPTILLTQEHIQRMMDELSASKNRPYCSLQYLDVSQYDILEERQ